MEIIAILGKQLVNFLGFRVETSFAREIRRLAGEKWTKLKNLLSRVYYLRGITDNFYE